MGSRLKITPTPLKSSYVFGFEPFCDDRGRFTRVYCQQELEAVGHNRSFVQVNISLTNKKGAIRGMHFQTPPKAEIKMVRCLKGSVFDVIIDLRSRSSTFLNWYGETLSADNMKTMYIPEGFAHGFQTLEEDSELLYFHSEYYSPECEAGIKYDDPLVGITWPLPVAEISDRDKAFHLLSTAFKGINL